MVETCDLVFHSNGVEMAGRFFLPAGVTARRRPCVIVTGSWLTVKEQMPSVYARRLAEAGRAAFVFDFAGFGRSGGGPRQTEIPARKIADLHAAAAALGRFGPFDPNRIGLLSICAGAQYALAALAERAPIAAFASVAGWFHDAASLAPFYGGPDGVRARLQRADAAMARYIANREMVAAPAYAPGDERAAMSFPLDYYARADRGAVPQWANEMAEMSWLYWFAFDGMASAERVITPTLMVHSDECALPDNARAVHAALKGPKELVWTTGSQTDFYDQPGAVDRAMNAVAPFFDEIIP